MSTLDDAIREHLELKRRKGAPEDELQKKEAEAFGRGGIPPAPAPADEPPAVEPSRDEPAEPASWESPNPTAEDLLEPDEVLPEESLEPNGTMPRDDAGRLSDELGLDDSEGPEAEEAGAAEPWETEAEPSEDLLEETPDFLEETPEHDRLWFEQKPPKDFDFD
jgi:hypothetical protein